MPSAATKTHTAAPSHHSPAGQYLRRAWVVCLGLALLTSLVYLKVAKAQFVDYDDGDYVTGNLRVQGGLTWANVVWAFTTGHASNWHPLTWLSHMLDWQLFGDHPAGPHLINLALHTLNTLLLFLLLRRSTGAHWRSAFVAGLFALHPVHVESVAWVSERKDLLSTLYFLLTLGAYGVYANTVGQARPSAPGATQAASIAPPGRGKLRKLNGRTKMKPPAPQTAPIAPRLQAARHFPNGFYLLALSCFALGLMSKPMLVTLPFVLLLLDVWPLGRLSLLTPRTSNSPLPRLLFEKIPFFLLSAASCTVTFIVQRHGGAVSNALSFSAKLANALVSYGRYLEKIFWPARLSVLYPHPGSWPAWQVALATALLVALSAAAIWLGRCRPYLLVGWCWFLGILVPVIGLVQVGVQSMADRYTYIPAIGIFIIVAWGAHEASSAWRARKQFLGFTAAAALLSCALLTSRQVGFWQDSGTLFQHAVEVTDKNYLAYNNLGYFFSGKGKTAEALENYQKSLQINPRYEDALNNMGYAMAGQKRYPEAIAYYEAALAVRTNQLEVHNNLGNALADTGRLDEAIGHYRFVLAHDPEHADAHNNLGIALAMQGKLDEAIEQFRQAVRWKPNYASAHGHLGNALALEHQLPEAIAEYKRCLQLNSDDAQAHNNLGNALAEAGHLDEAVEHYTTALRLNPNNPEAHFNFAMALARQGKRQEAIAHLQSALALKPDYAEAKQQLSRLKAPAP